MKPADPAVGGSEGVGSVVGIGPGVKDLAVNDWVIPVHSATGNDFPCIYTSSLGSLIHVTHIQAVP